MKNNELFGVEIITSKANSAIVKIGKLTDKKYRKQDKMFLCDGIKLFEESVDFCPDVRYIVVDNDVEFESKIIDKIKQKQHSGTIILCVTKMVFEKLTDEKSPQGIITVCGISEKKGLFSTSAKKEKIMILESVRDPGNVGTIMRNSAAFGIDRLILSSDCADIYSSKVVRAAMGAIFKVNCEIVDDLFTKIEDMKKSGYNILGAALKKDSLVLGNYKFSNNDAVVIGNEGKGLSNKILDICDNTLLVPMQDNTESLNAAMAATIIMWEMYKGK